MWVGAEVAVRGLLPRGRAAGSIALERPATAGRVCALVSVRGYLLVLPATDVRLWRARLLDWCALLVVELSLIHI